MGKPTFGISAYKTPRLNLTRIETDLWDAHQRLAQVTIECLPYSDVIQRYDRPDTFFYADPPYWGCEDYYGKEIFIRDDFQNLADLLSALKGKFMVSINDIPEIREIFKAFNIETASTFYSMNKNQMKPVQELIITNY